MGWRKIAVLFFCGVGIWFKKTVHRNRLPHFKRSPCRVHGHTSYRDRTLNVSFTDTSAGASISNRRWDFGDGNISDYSVATNPFHSYTSDGTYSVNLTVTNATGSNSLLRSNYITVTPPPADMTPPGGLNDLHATAVTNSSIAWNATLPADSDFNKTIILKNGVWFENWSNTTSSTDGLASAGATWYTISTRTCDLLENCNLTWQNSTAVTASTPHISARCRI